MIQVLKNVTLTIQGKHLVAIPEWRIESGKVYGLYGETGSGKSTIGKWLGGVEPIYWDIRKFENDADGGIGGLEDGQDDSSLSNVPPLYLLQDAYQIFNPYVTIETHFKDIWKHNKIHSELKNFDDIYDILIALGITDPQSLLHRKIHQVSQGEAQRMAFVMGFIRAASLRIYDEVFSNVDEGSSRKMLEYLREFCTQSGQSAVVISHETGLLKEYVDAAYVISDGILENATLEDSRPASQDSFQGFPLLISIKDMVVPGYSSNGRRHSILCKLPELVIGQGENVGLYGSSGLGKTTLLKGLLGEHDLSWSECVIQSIRKRNASRLSDLDIRYLPQSIVSAFNPAVRIKVSMGEIQEVHGVSDQELLELLSLFGLTTDHLQKYPNELSGGEIQRMGIISVLPANPDLILLDESFSSVDEVTRDSIWMVLTELQKTRGFAVLVVSHDVDWLRSKMNRVYRLDS